MSWLQNYYFFHKHQTKRAKKYLEKDKFAVLSEKYGVLLSN
jgi:hypothetical protein